MEQRYTAAQFIAAIKVTVEPDASHAVREQLTV